MTAREALRSCFGVYLLPSVALGLFVTLDTRIQLPGSGALGAIYFGTVASASLIAVAYLRHSLLSSTVAAPDKRVARAAGALVLAFAPVAAWASVSGAIFPCVGYVTLSLEALLGFGLLTGVKPHWFCAAISAAWLALCADALWLAVSVRSGLLFALGATVFAGMAWLLAVCARRAILGNGSESTRREHPLGSAQRRL